MAEKKPYSQKKTAYNITYTQTHLHRIPLDVQNKYYTDVLQPYVKSKGYSMNGFIKKCMAYCIANHIDLSKY